MTMARQPTLSALCLGEKKIAPGGGGGGGADAHLPTSAPLPVHRAGRVGRCPTCRAGGEGG